MALPKPHGPEGVLKPLLLYGEEREAEIKRAQSMPKVYMSSRETSDVLMLGIGAFTPLYGFMKKDDYTGCVFDLKLTDGTMWPMPVTLSITGEEKDAIGLKEGMEVALYDRESGELYATMLVEEIYTYDKEAECREVFKTLDAEGHPGVAKVMQQGEYNLGGPIKVVNEGIYPQKYPKYYLYPAEARKLFEEKGWSNVVAFQTRNPMHRSHEYLCKFALESGLVDGCFIHAIVGALKPGDIPGEVRVKCYEALVENYFPKENIALGVYPMEMRYGGPREALLHAVFRQNWGCRYLIVGRDHAGVGDYYGPFDAQKIFDTLWPGALELKPMLIAWTFYCYKCQSMASQRTCPHGPEDRCVVSGTKFRRMMQDGEDIPKEFGRPEVMEILREYYKTAERVEIKKGAYEDIPGPQK
ncbi:sulfate adenylyltransferase [Desulfallas sp. Bu1-1]|jgi:sulfate adenylyltransferase|uniref:sulfate adenylyltransferase n=1 Tax=Desulfallas sp. Bu1-1 TaxID=2787620 RepID=UPI00189F2F2A|nr:sulfate adenylyltransferase [Desulfallas sp. Bu1-1]MBF7083883.1 sulfate adenylyltransferase [Desulfallas sp. Bu1-1]